MIDHTPLDPTKLSPAAQKALGPGPAKMMAARGMAPLPPADQLCVLYQLTLDADANLASSARTTAAGLPEKLLAGALGDARLDPRVLDLFAPFVAEKPTAFDALVGNSAVADETIAVLAGKVQSREVERIAANEQRLLRHPAIIGAMYLNKHARMSTVDRAVELAVRNNVRVPGLAAWDEIARSLQGTAPADPVDDALFDAVLGVADAAEPGDDAVLDAADDPLAPTAKLLELHVTRSDIGLVRVPLRRTRVAIGAAGTGPSAIPGTPEQWLLVQLDGGAVTVAVASTGERASLALNGVITLDGARIQLKETPFRDLPVSGKIRLAQMGDAFVRAEALRDSNKLVAMAAAKSPAFTDKDAARIASNPVATEDVIRYVAAHHAKNYDVKLALCRNPKTPITEAMKFLPHLRERDMNSIMSSKGVPSAVVAQARKLSMQRRGGQGQGGQKR